MVIRFSVQLRVLSKAFLLCLGVLLMPKILSAQGCSCPPVANCAPCSGGINTITLQYTGGGIPIVVTTRDGLNNVVPGGIDLLTNIISVTSHDPANSPFRNGSLQVRIIVAGLGLVVSETIDTSCGTQLLRGSTFGELRVISATSLNGGPVCCLPALQDATPPVFTQPCPANQVLNTSPGTCTVFASWTPPTATDNCGSVSVTSSHNPAGTTFPVGTTTVTHTATDIFGNSSTCSFTVQVNDNIPPQITTCPPDAEVQADASCGYTLPDFRPLAAANDNCAGGVTFSQSPAPGTVINGAGTSHTVTMTASDLAGNSAVCTFAITISDDQNPVFTTCPTNMDVTPNSGCNYLLADFTTLAVASDNCGPVTITQSPVAGTELSGAGTIQTITLTATDGSGHTDVCSFDITLKDQEAPSITSCPEDQEVALSGLCNYVLADFTSSTVATDNCGSVTITQSPPAGTMLAGVSTAHAVIITATDGSGNSSTCTFNVTLRDLESPAITTCPPDADVVLNSACSYVVADFTSLAVASDNCGAVNKTQSPLPGTVLTGVGTTHPVTIKASDASGNSVECTFNITLKDVDAPVITTCPADADVLVNNACEYVVVDFTAAAAATDNCNTVTITQSPVAGTVLSGAGTVQTITLTASDASGNTDVCSFDITLKDQEAPSIATCPADQDIILSVSCNYVLADFTGSAVASDNCGSVTITQSPLAGTVLTGVGSVHEVTITATDGSGNSSSCTFDVTLKDTQSPVITTCPPDADVFLDGSCNYVVADYTSLAAGSDNCGPVVITQSPLPGTTLTGVETTHLVTITATDASGNSSQCTFNIILKDEDPPVITTCPSDTDVVLNNACEYVVADFTDVLVASGNCTTVSVTQSPVPGTVLSGVGTVQTITLTASDASGNTDVCSFDITLKDQEAPSIATCPADQDIILSVSCNYVLADFTGSAVASDNCGSVTITQSPLAGTVLTGVGSVHEVTITATDGSGNSSSCTFDVTLKDTQSPVITTCPPDADVFLDGSCNYVVADYTSLAAGSDNCGPVVITQSPLPGTTLTGAGTIHPVTITATDASGNSSQCTFNLTLKDGTPPVINNCPANITASVTAGCSYTVADFTTAISASDNCDASLTITQFPLAGTVLTTVGSLHTIQLTATDDGGNSTTCSFVITIVDDLAPVISGCPGDIIVDADPSLCGKTVSWTTPSVTDHCIPALTSTHASGSFFPVGETTVTYKAEDPSGNITLCNFKVTVKDIEGPDFDPIDNITVSTLPSGCGTVVTWPSPTALDECGVQSIVSAPVSGSQFFPGPPSTVIHTATDIHANVSTIAVLVTVVDNVPPVIPAMSDITVYSDPSACGKNVSWTSPLVTDNCEVLSVTFDKASGSFFPVGRTTVLVTAQDVNGNSSTTTFDVVVIDDTNPVIASMSDITINVLAACTATATWVAPVVTDNCGVQSVTSDFASGTTFPAGTTKVTYTALDVHGNSSTAFFKVHVVDNAPPAINCLPDIVVNATDGCAAIVTWNPPVVTDCGDVTLTSDRVPGTLFSPGTTRVVYTATDDSGNSSTCEFNVIVNDNTVPVFANCLPDIVVKAQSCTQVVTWTPPTVTDNCSVVSLSSSHNPGSSFPIGNTVVIYTAVDATGNSSTCSFNVVITDEDGPVFSNCPADMEVLVASEGAIEADWSSPVASVACGTVNVSATHQPGQRFPVGTTEVVYTATDEKGRTAECRFRVTVSYVEIEFDIPDLVTPNGDGRNDFWNLDKIERFVDNEVTIVDRWGGVVFQGKGYNNSNVVWGGQNKAGGSVPTGTYFYTITVRLGDVIIKRSGFLELVRK